MEKFIPYEKLSKKKKREQDSRRRSLWTRSPVTRRPKKPKAYNRKKVQDRYEDTDPVFVYNHAKPAF
ncbi:MAG: hypothetical protein IJH53_10110 [Oscillospiraceae bacterium]|nr:hypothetical protein [Oscillospiraceae bacterium]